jgi:hypothetical protein
MKARRIILILILAAAVAAVYNSYQVFRPAAPVATGSTEAVSLPARYFELADRQLILKDSAGKILQEVGFDSLGKLPVNMHGKFDSLLTNLSWAGSSNLNYNGVKEKRIDKLSDSDRVSVINFFSNADSAYRIESANTVRQNVFLALRDHVKKAVLKKYIVTIDGNKELMDIPAVKSAIPPVVMNNNDLPNRTSYIQWTLIYTIAVLLLLLLYSILLLRKRKTISNSKLDDMAKKKKPLEADKEALISGIVAKLGTASSEGQFFSETLDGYKQWLALKEQVKPQPRADLASTIKNLEEAGVLTATDRKKLFELHEWKEKISTLEKSDASAADKQDQLVKLLLTIISDESLKSSLTQIKTEDESWRQLMQQPQEGMPDMLAGVLGYFDQKFGKKDGTGLAALYNETRRKAELPIPENFVEEDQYLRALYDQYRSLLHDVYYTYYPLQHQPDKVTEAKQVLLNRIVQLALHAHSFLAKYTGNTRDLTPDSIKSNILMMMKQGKVKTSLSPSNYKTYKKDIQYFDKEIFLQSLFSAIGVTDLENVLVNGVYFPPESLTNE